MVQAREQELGVYISVPFCKAKCTFCNFASDAFGLGRLESYVARLCGEIAGARGMAAGVGAELPERVDTVYFGGGTPSLLEAGQVQRIFAALRGGFSVAGHAEVTLECAPGQLAEATLEAMLREGMNRISLGVQSFVDRESAAVGRLHTERKCREEMARLRGAGVEEISVDLIAGLPHQIEASWRYSVEQVVESGVPHASVYMLEVDEESRLGKEMLLKGNRYGAGNAPSEDETAGFYEMACERFEAAGLGQYEISNFARAGHQSRHNLKYWVRKPYVGFGLDAHSMLTAGKGAVRFANTDKLEEYLAVADGAGELKMYGRTGSMPEGERIGGEDAFEETMFLGLRLNDGVGLAELRAEFGDAMVRGIMPGVDAVREAGLVEIVGERVRLTGRGRMASNEVFSRLLVEVV